MAHFQVNLDGETYYIDSELEKRVQALEALLQDQSEEVKENLEISQMFFKRIEERQNKLLTLQAEAEQQLIDEGVEITPETLDMKMQLLQHTAEEE